MFILLRIQNLYVPNNYNYFIYQYRCIAGAYIDIPDSADKRIYQVCSLPPQQNIKCNIRAVNSAGVSLTATTDEITTSCGGELFHRVYYIVNYNYCYIRLIVASLFYSSFIPLFNNVVKQSFLLQCISSALNLII